MYRTSLSLAVFAALFLAANQANAQVSIRTPFGEVHTGGPAGTVVRAPFVNIRAGGLFGGVNVRAPFVDVNSPPRFSPYLPGAINPQQGKPPIVSVPRQPVPVAPGQPPVKIPTLPKPVPQGAQPPPQIIPPPPPASAIVNRPFTHHEFARVFRPAPGTFEVNFIHPGHRGGVVRVRFTLPPGQPRIHCGRKNLVFDYGHCQVEIRFRLFRRVTVEYD